MATAADIVFLSSVVPAVLIVSSTILLDRALRYEQLLYRCQIQIWMWLALSLVVSIRWPEPKENGNDTADENTDGSGDQQVVCFAWAHLTVFFNLSVILTESLQSRLIVSSKWKRSVRNALQILPISSWCSMVLVAYSVLSLYTTTTGSKSSTQVNTAWKLSLWTFMGTFLIIWLIRISMNRRKKISIDMQGIPTTTTTTTTTAAGFDPNNAGGIIARFCGVSPLVTTVDYKTSMLSGQHSAHCWLDERQWYTWTRIQTIQWFAQQLSSKVDNSICEEEKDMVVAILVSHRITGDVLEGLEDISQLIALRVPFGPAYRLSDSITELVERYPKPRSINSARGRTRRINNRLSRIYGNDSRGLYDGTENDSEFRASNDCLNLHDHEYNNALRSQQINEQPEGVDDRLVLQRHVSPQVPGSQHQHQYQNETVVQGSISEEQHEKLNGVMKERFGLELPKLKATDFLAVQKGLSTEANINHETILLSNNDMSQPHPFAAATLGNDYANGKTVPIPQKSIQDSPFPSSYIDNRSNFESLTSTSTPEQILAGMPPEIREIAKRRPDLIETIWKQQQQQVLKQPRKPYKATALPPTTKRCYGLPALPETTRDDSMMGEDRVDAGDDDYDSDDEDETTSLIHRDDINEFPPGYKSIDKSTLPGIV